MEGARNPVRFKSGNRLWNQKDARLWARLTGGLGRSQGEDPGEADWEELDEESLGDTEEEEEVVKQKDRRPGAAERQRRINKGRVARAAARARAVSYTHLTLPTIYSV